MATVKVLASKKHHYFTMNVNEVADSINVSNNTSNVNYSFVLSPKVKNYDWATGTYISYKLYINGEQVHTDYIRNYDGDSTVTLNSGTVTIPHNNDGTKTIDFSFEVIDTNPSSRTYTCGNASGSGTQELTTIPRASSFTLSKTSGGTETTSFSLGDNIYANITRASTSFNHKVYFVIGSSGNQVLSNSATTVANTTLANLLAQYIPGTSGTATMYVKTYNGSTSSESNLIGTTTATFTISVPSSVVPSITSVTKSDTQNYLSTYGAYVQGKSKLKVVTVASGNYSTITGCTVKLKNGSTVLNTATATLTSGHYDATFTNLATVGTITVEVTVTDSRSRTATNSSTITVTGYSNPSISTLTAERRNNDNSVTLTFNALITNINNANANSKTFTLRKKKSSDSDEAWNWITLITYTGGYSVTQSIYPTSSCDGNYAWDFELIAEDSFTTTTKRTTVGTAFELINWGSDGTSIAFGKVAEKSNSFECDLDTYLSSVNKDNSTLNLYGTNIVSKLKSKNMITGWFIGSLSTTNGSETTTTSGRRTGFIEADIRNNIYIVSGLKTSYTSVACFYDSNYTYLGRTGTAQRTSLLIDLRDDVSVNNAKYMRLAIYSTATDSDTTTIQLEEGSNSTTFYEGKGYGSIFGSNENGFYQKFEDGTLVQWGEGTFGTSGTSTDSYVKVTFPIRFIVEGYNIMAQVRYTGSISQNYTLATILTPSAGGVSNNYIYRRLSYLSPTDSGQSALYATALPFYWIAIGRWK